jgi:hypothetical protein
MLWLRDVLHPEKPSKLNLREKLRETYKEIYDYRLSEDEIDNWLRLTENQDSAFYDMFKRTI